jgi:hypothetical protein
MVRVNSSLQKLRKNTKDRNRFDYSSEHSHINGWHAPKCTSKCIDN